MRNFFILLPFSFLLLSVSCTEETVPLETPTPIMKTDYIGLSVPEAQELAKSKNELFRVVKKEGQRMIITKDMRPGRINAEVENGKITGYRVE